MSTVAEIQKAIERLPQKDQAALTAWLQSREQPILSKQEEAALLASLDKAAAELDAGRGVSRPQTYVDLHLPCSRTL
jgi:hypothetical protein